MKKVLVFFATAYSDLYLPGITGILGKYSDSLAGRVFSTFAEFKGSDIWTQANIVVTLDFDSAHFQEILRHNPIDWVHSIFTAVTPLMVPEFIHSPIPLTCSKGSFNQPIVEYCMTMIFFFHRNLDCIQQRNQARQWKFEPSAILTGKVVGILGYGSIGKDLARFCKFAGLRVIGVKRERTEADGLADKIVGVEEIETVLPECDYLVMALPNVPETQDLVNDRVLALMKNTAVLINVGRGQSVDEEALLRALHSGQIRGAALDVVKNEPLSSDSPLWGVPNLLITPHNSFYTTEAVQARIDQFESFLQLYLSGEALPLNVSKTKGY